MIFNYYNSGLKEEICGISVNELYEFAVNLADRYMTERRMEILEMMSHEEPKTITSMVSDVSATLNCPKSTVWMNVNLLRELGLIKSGNGMPVKVTAMGMLILERNADGNNNRA